jgi:hypothetical protein
VGEVAVTGDYDADGDVDANDYQRWVDRYGTADPAADGNGDGAVDAADYSVWRDVFAPTPTLAVPEPSTTLLAAAGMLAMTSLWITSPFVSVKR